jgi:hypothetical protein
MDKVVATLCVESHNNMLSWMHAIENFHNCLV